MGGKLTRILPKRDADFTLDFARTKHVSRDGRTRFKTAMVESSVNALAEILFFGKHTFISLKSLHKIFFR
jgi:hypothetical protein